VKKKTQLVKETKNEMKLWPKVATVFQLVACVAMWQVNAKQNDKQINR